MSRVRRIGILTGGGDCPGLNAVIRAVAKSAIFEHGLEVVGINEGFGGLIENNWRMLRDEDVSGILPRGGTILGANNRDNPFMFRTVASGGEVTYEDNSGVAIANLVGMGVLPLQYGDGQNAEKLGLMGQELFDIEGISKIERPRQELTVRAKKPDGSVTEFKVIARLDIPIEIEYYKNGGILQTVLRQLIKQG